jgi:hypothetical protein
MSGTVRQGIALHTNVESLVKNKQAARVLGEPHVRRSFTRWVALRNARPVCSGGARKNSKRARRLCRLGDCVARLTVGTRPRGSQLARPRGSAFQGHLRSLLLLLLLAPRCRTLWFIPRPNTPQNTNTPLCFVWLQVVVVWLRAQKEAATARLRRAQPRAQSRDPLSPPPEPCVSVFLNATHFLKNERARSPPCAAQRTPSRAEASDHPPRKWEAS